MMLDSALSYVNTSTVLTFGVALVIAAYILQPGRRRYNLPPFPWTRVPLFGNIFTLLWSKDKAYISFFKASKTKEYSKVFMIQLGSRDICVVNDIELVKEALTKKPVDFAGRPSIFSGDLLTQNKDILFGNYGPVWRFHRKVAHKALRNFASGKNLERIVQSAVTEASKEMSTFEERPFVLKSYIELLVINMLCGMCFGTSYEYDDPEFKKFTNISKDGLEAFGSGLPADVFPWLSWLPFQGRSILKIIKILIDSMEDELRKHKDNFDPDHPRDILDYLLCAQREAESEDADMRGTLTDTHLVMTTFDVFGAGLDTINAVLQNAIAMAIEHPDEQEKIYEEVKSVLGGRFPEIADRSSLPLTEAFLYESMRLHTLSVLGMPLATTCDTTIGGYELPKDTMVMINFWALHNDPDHWARPAEFRPQRFLGAAGEALGPRPPSFLPFSAGRRVCLGETLAKTALMMILPALTQKFRFLPGPGFSHEMEDSGLAAVPKPYPVFVEQRE